ncbi:MAG: phosphonate C-P lyase system protein PhnG [Alphaproteobacteria bacterium]
MASTERDRTVGTVGPAARQRWMAVLAHAGRDALERACQGLPPAPAHDWLRRPEVGMAMVRGRAGGDGARFNLGEMTVTRCAVRLADGTIGVAYVAGRDKRHAELAALCDALLQLPGRHDRMMAQVIDPLAAAQSESRRERGRKAAATRVDFFTMVRGENPR